jgi:hypothetical protein
MNENDKILIHAYLDGETSESESSYIESLLESNKEANEYANNIKRASAEINSFYQSENFRDLETNISSFIRSRKRKSKSSSFEKFIRNIFTTPKLATFALVSIIYFNVGYLSEDSLKNYEDKLILTEVMKLRSGSDNLSDAVKKSLNNMIENKSRSGILIYGNEEYDLSLNKFSKKGNTECYKGTVNEKSFKYCRIGSDGELILD